MHTKGPWEMRDSQISPAIYIMGDHTHIATINGELDYYSKILPNAHLIAAAPDLLVACEAVLQWAYTDIVSEEGTIGYFAEHVVPMVDEAVENAKGE